MDEMDRFHDASPGEDMRVQDTRGDTARKDIRSTKSVGIAGFAREKAAFLPALPGLECTEGYASRS
jgi:hypothetical protein